MTCQGILGRLFGHKYRPRYDVKERERGVTFKLPEFTGPAIILSELIEATCKPLTDSTYVRDVCVRCGEQRKREGCDGQ